MVLKQWDVYAVGIFGGTEASCGAQLSEPFREDNKTDRAWFNRMHTPRDSGYCWLYCVSAGGICRLASTSGESKKVLSGHGYAMAVAILLLAAGVSRCFQRQPWGVCTDCSAWVSNSLLGEIC